LRAAWIEIDRTALQRNLSAFQRLLGGTSDCMGIVKANAYGHGAVPVSRILAAEGIAYFGVALVQEGIELRENGLNGTILVLGYTPPPDFEEAIRNDLSLTIYTLDQALTLEETARKLNKVARVHLKIDTGMGRIGFIPSNESILDIIAISKFPHLTLEGIYSHQAWADHPDGESHARKQFERFRKILKRLLSEGISFGKIHLANSAATIKFPEMRFDLVRIGISMYGLYPDSSMARDPVIALSPVMSVKARLANVKRVPPGSCISYGCTYITARSALIGTIPMGYGDGIPRLLSNRGAVLVKGRRCPIVGRICMDQFMVDLTDLKEIPTIGEEVVFLGRQGEEEITADEIATQAQTINYEIVTRMSPRLPRRYIDTHRNIT